MNSNQILKLVNFSFKNCTIICKLLLLLPALLVMANESYGQLSIVNSDTRMVEIGSLQANGIANISINDTAICSAIEFELFDDLNDSLILNRVFEFDQNSGLPTGMSWSRFGNDIQINLGTFSTQTVWKVRMRLKDTSNNWTSWNESIFN